MKRKFTGLISLVLICALFMTNIVVYAEDGEKYTIESAVEVGLENSILLQQLEDKITLSELKYRAYKDITSDLDGGQDELGEGEKEVETAYGTIVASQETLNNAKLDLLSDYYPEGFDPYTVIPETQFSVITIPELTIIPGNESSNRKTVTEQFQEYAAENAGLVKVLGPYASGNASLQKVLYMLTNPEESARTFTKQVKQTVRELQATLDEGKIDYEEGLLTLVDGKIDFAVAKANIASSLAKQLDMSELSKLSVSDDRKLLLQMSKSLATVTFASKGIYRDQIALQIQNSYYNALKAKKLVDVKKSTLDRAETQYQFSKDGYETGMKAKDSMLLSDLFLTGARLEYDKAVNDYENSLIELKKNINIPMDMDITLEEADMNETVAMSLEEGLALGLEGRLEIIKAAEQVDIYDTNLTVVKRHYNNKSEQYKEALRLKNLAILEQEKAAKDVESSIRQSYNTMKTMEAMLEQAGGMAAQARECVDIAQSKYTEGFGTDSALLDKLGIAASSGTVLEVISAEENLIQVEEKYIEILYGFNLAKAKYLSDIAYLTY